MVIVMAQPLFPKLARTRAQIKARIEELKERIKARIRGQMERRRRSPVIEKPRVKTY